MMLDNVGMYGHRVGTRRWHLIESEIGMTFVTRCGRRMVHGDRQATIEVNDAPRDEGICFYCNKRRVE